MHRNHIKLNSRFGLRFSAYNDQGGRPYNEDKFSLVYLKNPKTGELSIYIGIFDGHGGVSASVFAKNHLMNFIVSEELFWSDNDEDVFEAIRIGFKNCHEAMWRDLDNWPETPAGLPSTAGTTASIAFIRKGKVYTGHCGDSGIVLGTKPDYESNRLDAQMLTIDHKPDAPEERERIVKSGGSVAYKNSVWRVVWKRPKGPHRGPLRRNTEIEHIPFLAVARSLGDLWSFDWVTKQFAVSYEPDVSVFELDPQRHKCLIFASDGLWNVLDGDKTINLFNETDIYNRANIGRDWKNPSKVLVERALEIWGPKADNITVVCIEIDETTSSNNVSSHGIYDHETRDYYDLNYIDPSAQPQRQQLPSFSNVASHNYGHSSTFDGYHDPPNSLYYCSSYESVQKRTFVKGCCPDERYELADDENTVIEYHTSTEHHKQQYEMMLQQKVPPLHYTYRAVANHPLDYRGHQFFDRTRGRYTKDSYSYVRPSDAEFIEMHQDEKEENKVEPQTMGDEINIYRATTPLFDEDDEDEDEEMEWSDSDEAKENENATNEAQENFEASATEQIAEVNDSIQINEVSSSNSGKDIEDEEEGQVLTQVVPSKKRKSTTAQTTPIRFHQTRQADRKTRSNRIFGIENSPRTSRAIAKKPVKKSEVSKAVKKVQEDISSKNKENKRELRSAQKEKPSALQRVANVVQKLRTRVQNPSATAEKSRKRGSKVK